MKVLIIGSGNMGRTYAKSFLASRSVTAADLYVLDKSREKASTVADIPNANIYLQAAEFIGLADVVILAVKPQDFPSLAAQISAFIKPQQLILSIMAGIKIATIMQLLPYSKVVRSMPNLPAQIGMGMTVFTSSASVDKHELTVIQNLINTTGRSVYVEDESMIDAATAISGSGPAYVYYFMQAMIEAGIAMGFTQAQAELLVNQTFMGAVHLHDQSEFTCQEWISKVASKGGTTEAAVNIFNGHTLNEKIREGLFGALERARQLGQ